jgi:hypothetical protein
VKETFAKTQGDPYSAFEREAMAALADAEPVDAMAGGSAADADDLPF